MKTTVEIDDPLLREAKKLAVRDGTTLRALIERSLRQLVHAEKKPKKVKLKIKPFRGGTLRPGFETLDWDKIRDIVYQEEDRFR